MKKLIDEGMNLCSEYGYWSEEVRYYIGRLDTIAKMDKVANALGSLFNSNQPQASIYFAKYGHLLTKN